MLAPPGRLAATQGLSPRVSIGLPVWNGAATIAAALDALVTQDFIDFELIVGDNASTDATAAIIADYAARDARIRVVRHAQNLGAFPNFAFVLDAAKGEFFLWAACDDRWSRDFLSLAVAALDARPDAISAVTPVHFEGAAPDPVRLGDGLLDAPDTGERVLRFVSYWHGNSVFYSLFRRRILAAAMRPAGSWLGFDWSVMLRATRHGPSLRLPSGWLERGARGLSSNTAILTRTRSRGIHWLLPFAEVTADALRSARRSPLQVRVGIVAALARLNLIAARAQATQAWRER